MKSAKSLFIIAAALMSVESRATLYFDLEKDSIPVISISVVLPAGFQAYRPEDSGVLNLLGEIFDQGALNVNRANFYKQMASFGANSSFAISNEATTWSLDFPYLKGKDYSPLFHLLAEQFRTPRFTDEALKLAKLKMGASLKASLDNDSSLVAGTASRIRAFKDFHSFPIMLDSLEKITLDKVKKSYEASFSKEMDGWAGVVGPESALPEIERGLKAVFPNLGDIKHGTKKSPLEFSARKPVELKPYNAAVIIDRPDRTQTLTSFTWLKPGIPSSLKSALAQAFGNYILSDGLNSYFAEEIRTKRGLAYAVAGIDDVYLGQSITGLLANPQRARNAESTDVIGQLVKNAYEESNVFSLMSSSDWNTRFKSYQYDYILSQRTPDGRLGRRATVIEGDVYPGLALSSPDSWRMSAKEATQYFRERYEGSSRLLVVEGDAKELTPIVEKSFPNFKVIAVPYKDLLQTDTFQKLIMQF
jgi:predicted Zn-dependent peptidase